MQRRGRNGIGKMWFYETFSSGTVLNFSQKIKINEFCSFKSDFRTESGLERSTVSQFSLYDDWKIPLIDKHRYDGDSEMYREMQCKCMKKCCWKKHNHKVHVQSS